MFIHKKIRPRNNGINNDSRRLNSNIQVSNACLTRVRNTEYYRKQKFKSTAEFYDNTNAPDEHVPGDGGDSDNDADHGDEEPSFRSMKLFRTCSHYRQLSSLSVAAR